MNNIFLKKIENYLLYFIIAAFPLFFLPGRVSPALIDAYAKLFFLIFFVSVLLFIRFAANQRQNEEPAKPVFLMPILVFSGIYFFASLIGLDFSRSFWGQGNAIFFPISGLLSLILFYYILVQAKQVTNSSIKSLFYGFSAIVVVLLVEYIFHWFGFLSARPQLFDFFRKLTGSYEDVSVYLSLVAVFLAGFLFLGAKPEKQSRTRLALTAIWLAAVFLVMNINYLPAWWCFFGGSLVLIYFERFHFQQKKKANVIYFMGVLSLVFLLLNFFATGQAGASRQREALNFRMSFQPSLSVVKNSLAKNLISGQGAESLPYSLSKDRPQALNEGSPWNIRFLESSSFLLNLFLVSGSLGLLAFLYFLFNVFFVLVKSAARMDRKNNLYFAQLAFLAAIAVSFLFFAGNLLIFFLFFLALGLIERQIKGQALPENKFLLSGREFARIGNLPQFIAILRISGLIFLIIVFVFNAKILFAEMLYRSSFEKTGPAAKAKALLAASQLNDMETRYKEVLAKLYKNEAFLAMEKNKEDIQGFQDSINNAISLAREAVQEAPHSVSAFETLAVIYRDIAETSPASIDLALENFAAARSLEPSNPVILTEMGKLLAAKKDYIQAEIKFLEAIDLKDDYYIAKFELAKTLEAQSRFDDALKILSDIEDDYNKVELYYEWGKIEFNRGRIDEAERRFNEVLKIEPRHSNALFGLALVFERRGQAQAAIEYYRKVDELNPGNDEVRKKIQMLGGVR